MQVPAQPKLIINLCFGLNLFLKVCCYFLRVDFDSLVDVASSSFKTKVRKVTVLFV